MAFLLANLFFLLLLLILLIISGIFSGVETVLFSLSRFDRARMKKSANRLEVLAAALLENPRPLLTSLITGNMTCNVIYFVLSSMLLGRLDRVLLAAEPRAWAGVVVSVLSVVPPLLVTYMADVFPKVIGSLNNTRIAPLIALPVATLVRVLWPVSWAIDLLVMRPVHRLVAPRSRRRGGGGGAESGGGAFSAEELRALLEMSEQEGVIDVSENELLQEVVRIADLKVRDVMTPRVDIIAFNLKESPEKLVVLFGQTHLSKIPVFEGQIDNLLGLVYAKTVLLELDPAGGVASARKMDVRKLLQPMHFVPEQQPLDHLLSHFRQSRTQIAVVVDEYGGLVGIVALDDVVEQMVGDIYEPHDKPQPTLERIGPDEYLVPGDLSMADWIDAFGPWLQTMHTTTVAGLVAALLQRLPKEGDEVKLPHLSMRVQSMRGRRVDKVRLKLLTKAEEAGPEAPA